MKTLYAIRDRVAEELVSMQMYSVFVFKTDQQAARYFADAILSDKSILNQHPSDYELIKIGVLSDNGTIDTPWGPPHIIITGDALTATQPKTDQPSIVVHDESDITKKLRQEKN